jgi:nitric oxide reductase large subunit
MGLFFFTFWPLFVFWQIGLNPLILHQHGAVNLVIGSFAIGFLLTALPRFTGTSKASRLDVAVLGIATVLEFVGLLMNFPGFAALMAARTTSACRNRQTRWCSTATVPAVATWRAPSPLPP